MIVGSAEVSAGLVGSELLRQIRAYLGRDAPKNLLRLLEMEVKAEFEDAVATVLLEQFAEEMRREEVFSAFRDFVETSSPDALSDVQTYLEDGLERAALDLSPKDGSTRLVDILRSRLAEAQPSLKRAVDARGEFDRAANAASIAAAQEDLRRGQQDLAGGIEEVALMGERTLDRLNANQMTVVRFRYASRDSTPEAAQGAVQSLAAASPDLLERLYATAGDPIDVSQVAGLIERPPAWADQAIAEYHRALARVVETAGDWTSAITAWERAADVTEGAVEQADAYARAAVAAGVAGDGPRRQALLDRARDLCPEAPRLLMEEMPDDLPPAERLELLERIDTNEVELRALVAAERALAHLLTPDLAAAGTEVAIAEDLAPGSVATRCVALNLHIQRGRLDFHEGHPIDGPALRGAWQQALSLRERLLSERRYEESGRLLMLAGDALVVSGERERAVEIIGEATEEERRASEGAEVLGDAALRLGAERLALRLIADVPETPALVRIRATAEFFTGSSDVVLTAGEKLDAIVAEGGREADHAAVARLTLPLFREAIEWSKAAEEHLLTTRHARAAVSARAIHLANIRHDYDAAYALLAEYDSEVWAAVARFRVAVTQRLNQAIIENANALLSRVPDQIHVLDCAAALRRAQRPDLAANALRPIVRERGTPGDLCSRGFDLLMRSLFDQGAEAEAATVFEEWQRERPGDQRLNPWQPRIANRARRGAPGSG